MKSKHIFSLVLIFVFVGLIGSSSLFAQEKMKFEDYLAEMTTWQDRENAAKTRIAALEKDISDLEAQIRDVEAKIQEIWDEIWRLLRTDERGLRQYLDQLNRLRDQIRGLMNLSPGDLYKRRDEAAGVEERFNELKSNAAAKHPDAKTIISDIESLLRRLQRALENAAPQFDLYSVVKGDYLFKISGKQDIYSDPYQWLKIWTKNRELIKNPDLIYPGWSLKIPRDIADNEYLVVKGDNLSKIAKQLFSDPLKWRQLFELNNTVIKDQNVIYPYMIIIKP